MAAATVTFGVIVWVTISVLDNDKAGLFTAAGCFAAIFVTCVGVAAMRAVRTRELRTFLVTLAVWTGLVAVMVFAAALTR